MSVVIGQGEGIRLYQSPLMVRERQPKSAQMICRKERGIR